MAVVIRTPIVPPLSTRVVWRRRLAWLAPLFSLFAIGIAVWVWWVRGEPVRQRVKVIEVIARRDTAGLDALLDETERKELGLTSQAARTMLQEALWNRGAARPARVQLYSTGSLSDGSAVRGWQIEWADAGGTPIRVPMPGPGGEGRALPLTSILMIRSRRGRTTINLTLFVKTLYGYPLHRPEDARRFRDLCDRVGVRGFANGYFVPFPFSREDDLLTGE